MASRRCRDSNTDIWELTPGGWVQSPAELALEAPGPGLSIDGGRFLSGDGSGPWNASVLEKDATSVWRTSAVLRGKMRRDGIDDEFRGGPADLSGDWAVVHQPDGEDDPVPETYIFHDYGGTTGWNEQALWQRAATRRCHALRPGSRNPLAGRFRRRRR